MPVKVLRDLDGEPGPDALGLVFYLALGGLKPDPGALSLGTAGIGLDNVRSLGRDAGC